MNRIIILLTVFFLTTGSLFSQVSIKDSSITIPMFYVAYSYQFPGGDMAERFGGNSTIGPGFQVKTSKNFVIGAEADFIFGSDVKYGFSIFDDIMTSEDIIINGDGIPAVVVLSERGWIISGKFGKVFPVLSPNPNSGIVVHGSIGYLQHKIRIEVENNSAPQLKGDYNKGYDRLTGGFCLSEGIGYLYIGNGRIANFYVGIEFYQAWTKSRRDYIFDLYAPESGRRFDMLIGPKISWMIPFHKRAPQEYYYY